jgi:hypothetical protein
MISDRDFKKLIHSCKGYDKHLKGEEIESGYKPDFVLRKGNDFLILESENSSNRKTFVGGMIKAAHYLQDERSGTLVFIMVPKDNTTAKQITEQLRTYFNWIKDKTNLREVYVIEAGQYYLDDRLLELLGADFNTIALKV